MSIQDDILGDLNDQISKTVDALKHDLAKLRTGRANTSILDGIRVSYYGTLTPLNQCAQLAVPEARMITVKPWDKGLIGEIEKAILHSDVGITPQNDGEMIRLPIPSLNEERRRELVKHAKNRGEEAKIALRNHRREANELLKEAEKDKELPQDDLKRALEKVQHIVDEGGHRVDEVLAAKEKEILEV